MFQLTSIRDHGGRAFLLYGKLKNLKNYLPGYRPTFPSQLCRPGCYIPDFFHRTKLHAKLFASRYEIIVIL